LTDHERANAKDNYAVASYLLSDAVCLKHREEAEERRTEEASKLPVGKHI